MIGHLWVWICATMLACGGIYLALRILENLIDMVRA